MKKVRVLLGCMAVVLPLAGMLMLSDATKQAEIIPIGPEIRITISI